MTKLNATKIAGECSDTMKLDSSLTSGKYYYFVRMTAGDATMIDSKVCEVYIQ